MPKEEEPLEKRIFKARRHNRPQVSPAKYLVVGYVTIILIGAILLSMPFASVDGKGLAPIDALFTATSALCVTGLVVVNTAYDLSVAGQIIVMILIQIGALGIMTMSTLFALLLGRRISLRNRLIIRADLNQDYLAGLVRLVRYVLALTFIAESLGALIMFLLFWGDLGTKKALYFAVFHSISAFGNAGFDLFGNSLESFTTNIPISLTFAGLFIIGGLGFTVIADVLDVHWQKVWSLSLHSKLVLRTTAILIVLGWAIVLIFEHANPHTLGELPWSGKLIASFFTAVTPRTAGFNTVPTGALTNSILFVIMFLMFIGASPGSTGGGVKTSTVGVLVASVYATITGESEVNMYRRRIANDQVLKAFAIVTLSLLVIVVAITILLVSENTIPPMQLIFESISAFGTVGLSTGITSSLSSIGKVIIIFLMFVGRVGPMTLALALGENKPNHKQIRYPEEPVQLG